MNKIAVNLEKARNLLPVKDEDLNKWQKEEWQFYNLLKVEEFSSAWEELRKVADEYFVPPLLDVEFWKTMALIAVLLLKESEKTEELYRHNQIKGNENE